MKKHPIDELFKNKLTDSTSQPSNDSWSKIETALNEKSKPAYFSIYKIAAALLLLFSVASVIIYYSGPEDKNNHVALLDTLSSHDNDNKKPSTSTLPNEVTTEQKSIKEEITQEQTVTQANEGAASQPKKNIDTEKKKEKQHTQPAVTKQIHAIAETKSVDKSKSTQLEEKEKLTNDATTKDNIASNNQIKESNGTTLTFNIEDFASDKKQVASNETSSKTANEQESSNSTLKKVVKFAKEMKESEGPLAEIRKAKNDLFALNNKKNENSK